MGYTFEELAGRELDALWHGALFLHGGEARGAEQLLTRALWRAMGRLRSEGRPADPRAWLETELVRAFLDAEGPPQTGAPHRAGAAQVAREARVQDPRVAALLAAARDIPAPARAALWLVQFQRRLRADAARVLRVDPESMGPLLEHRAALVRALDTGRRESGGAR